MKRRNNILIWLVTVLAIVIQTAVPYSALADVTVRCNGAPASAIPCAHAIVPMNGMADSPTQCPSMVCCRRQAIPMRACHEKMAMSPGAAQGMTPSASQAISAPKCSIAIRPLGTSVPIVSSRIHRWMLDASPSTAPPASGYAIDRLSDDVAAIISRPQSHALAPRRPSATHGLRAPPAS